MDKYGFYDTDNAFISEDGHCWSDAIDLLNCRKEDTGDTVILKGKYIRGEYLSCEASVYRILPSETDYKYSGFNETDVLYVAIGKTKNGFMLVSHNNLFWDEAIKSKEQRKQIQIRIIVVPEDKAVSMAASVTEKTAIISITNLLSRDVSFPTNDNILRIHRMKFDDEYYPKGNGPKQECFDGLKEFVDDIYGKVNMIIIHCAAGMSRSPAVAEAIVEYLDSEDVLYEGPDYMNEKNPLVYRFACSELGKE